MKMDIFRKLMKEHILKREKTELHIQKMMEKHGMLFQKEAQCL